jgi:hypothetical protein
MCGCNTAQHVRVSLNTVYSSEQEYQPYFSYTITIHTEGTDSVCMLYLSELMAALMFNLWAV